MNSALKSLAIAGISALLLVSVASNGAAQKRRGPSGADDQFLKKVGLKLGDKLPDASGYDINGKPFALKDIKGSHAVIVFGCMT